MLPDEVRKAVERLTELAPCDYETFKTIRAHLLARDVEVERLEYRLTTANDYGKQCDTDIRALLDRAERAEANLEAANKAVDTYREMLVSIIKVVRERDDRQLQAHIDATGITAHLSENSR